MINHIGRSLGSALALLRASPSGDAKMRIRVGVALGMAVGTLAFGSQALAQGASSTAPAAAAPLTSSEPLLNKIGYVNVDRIVQEAAPAKAASAKIDAEFAKRDRDLSEMGARLKSLGEKLERDIVTLADSERTRRQREVADLDRELQRRQREFREDLNQRRNEELGQIFEKTQRVIKQIAEQEKFDIVIRDAVFVNPRIDITDKVIRALGSSPSASVSPSTGK